jgi:phosphoserine aminotransferase
MTKRVYNFCAGPGMLPLEVLETASRALLDWNGLGYGIAECSHRSKEFDEVLDEAIARCRALLSVPDTHDVLFLQGGATQLFATVPMTFLNGPADYLVTGEWSRKAASMAKTIAGEKIRVIASSADTDFDRPPVGWRADPSASYFHVCSNETVHGHRLAEWPHHPHLIVDASSEMMSRPHPIARTALVYAGAQKNLGPAGTTLVIVRRDLYERIGKHVPGIFNLKEHAAAKSCLNTPPTFGVFFLLQTFRWMERQGGLAAIEKRNAEKAQSVYATIDGSGGFYTGTVADKSARSHMNVTFRLPSEDLTKLFLKEAEQADMVALKGYRTVGGIRASLYNAMPMEGCQRLNEHMRAFLKKYG